MAAYTAAQFSEWRATLATRQARSERELEVRRLRALELVRQAADLLRREFNATGVFLFGSLAHGLWYSGSSDIDLAVAGLSVDAHLRATTQLNDLSQDFNVDILRWESCPEALRSTIERDGIEL